MRFKQTTVGGTVEILAADDFTAIPVTVTGEAVVKAGMPLKLDGTAVPAGTGANGILLYDVNPLDNPNAALVVAGVVDWAKCQEHSGATATAEAMKAILPAVTFRENIGVTPSAADAPSGSEGGENT